MQNKFLSGFLVFGAVVFFGAQSVHADWSTCSNKCTEKENKCVAKGKASEKCTAKTQKCLKKCEKKYPNRM